MTQKYKVLIDDNYHYMGESKPLDGGAFHSLENAIERCKEITIKSLEHMYEEGISPEKLSAQWSMFGDDPFIVGGTESVPFSARKWITLELCQSIIDAKVAGK